MGVAPYDLYDSLDFFRVFFPRGVFQAAVEIDGIGRDGPDGFFDIAFMEAARQDQRIKGFYAPGQIPVGLLARPPVASGCAMIQQDRPDRIIRQDRRIAIPLKRHGLDETLCGKPATVIRRFITVELDQVNATKINDINDI
jgi:hypothetical protein